MCALCHMHYAFFYFFCDFSPFPPIARHLSQKLYLSFCYIQPKPNFDPHLGQRYSVSFFTIPHIVSYQTFLLARQLSHLICIYIKGHLKQATRERFIPALSQYIRMTVGQTFTYNTLSISLNSLKGFTHR